MQQPKIDKPRVCFVQSSTVRCHHALGCLQDEEYDQRIPLEGCLAKAIAVSPGDRVLGWPSCQEDDESWGGDWGGFAAVAHKAAGTFPKQAVIIVLS